MSVDEDIYDLDSTCRVCSKIPIEKHEIMPFFNDPASCQEMHPEVLEEIAFFNIELQENDGLPQQICLNCNKSFLAINKFRKRCKEIQEIMKLYFDGIKIETRGEIENIEFVEVDTDKEVEWLQDSAYTENRECIKEDSVNLLNQKLIQNVESIEDVQNDDDSQSNDINDSECIQISESFQNSDSMRGDESIVDSDDDLSEIDWKCEYFIPPEYDDGKDSNNGEKEIEENKYFCKYCNKSFALSTSSSNHMKLCPDRKEICKLCTAVFQTNEELKSHLEAMHSNDDKPTCPLCSRSFSTVASRNSHLNLFHAPGPKPTCDQCQRSFANKRTLQHHMKRVHSTVDRECSICKKKFTTEIRYKYHLLSHNAKKNFQCQYCDKSFLQSHHKKTHELSHTGERPYLCCFCGKSFRYHEAYKRHLMRYHPDEAIDEMIGNASMRATTLFPFSCSVCAKGFTVPVALADHLKTHSEDRPHVCKECGCSFKRFSYLKIHNRRIHYKIKAHECKECGKMFAEKCELNAHMVVHSDIRPFNCSYCERTFKRRADQRIHERSHTGEKPFGCEICPSRFGTSMSLATHIMTKHSDHERKAVEQNILGSLELNSKTIESQKSDHLAAENDFVEVLF